MKTADGQRHSGVTHSRPRARRGIYAQCVEAPREACTMPIAAHSPDAAHADSKEVRKRACAQQHR